MANIFQFLIFLQCREIVALSRWQFPHTPLTAEQKAERDKNSPPPPPKPEGWNTALEEDFFGLLDERSEKWVDERRDFCASILHISPNLNLTQHFPPPPPKTNKQKNQNKAPPLPNHLNNNRPPQPLRPPRPPAPRHRLPAPPPRPRHRRRNGGRQDVPRILGQRRGAVPEARLQTGRRDLDRYGAVWGMWGAGGEVYG